MAFTTLILENPNTGEVREAPVGFSWTVFFFGFFPALFRKDWKWGGIIFLLHILTLGIATIVFMFIYNKLYIKDLIGKGYKVKSSGVGTIEQTGLKLGFTLPKL